MHTLTPAAYAVLTTQVSHRPRLAETEHGCHGRAPVTSMIEIAVILESDDRGRVRAPPAQREALLDEFERSGLSGMRFAPLHGVARRR